MKLWNRIKAFFTAGTAAASSPTTDTEFTAEVVRITRVLPHPNADRLEIARFEMKGVGETSYEVVIQKGSYSVGDLATYFSVDCLLPTKHPEFAFLTSRLDGAGKEVYRLKAARLRGVFSQGLLVPAPKGSEWGAAMAEEFGVSYYRAPEPAEPGLTQPTKKPRPQPMPVYGVDSLKKLPRLFEDGEPVVVTEKIHGTNFRFGWVRRKVLGIPFGWRFVIGSHRTIKNVGSAGFYGEDVWMQAANKYELASRTRDYPGHIFYGELYGYTDSGKKIQDLTYGLRPEYGPGLRIFDVQYGGQWLSYFQREVVCADCGLLTVPVLAAYTPYNAETVKKLAEGMSFLERKQIREGVVVESTEGPRRKAKYVSEQYLTRKEA